jgi:hypothetical protein
MFSLLKEVLFGPKKSKQVLEPDEPMRVISTCVHCGSQSAQDVKSLKEYTHLPHCHWCQTVFDMDGKYKPVYNNTMVISQIEKGERVLVDDEIYAEFQKVGRSRPDYTPNHALTLRLLSGEPFVSCPTGRGPW